MKNVTGICLVFIGLFSVPQPARSQFIGTETDSSLTLAEVRKGSIVEYSLQADANPGEEFRWEVTGGKIITSGAVGEGTIADPSIIEFAADMHTIEVQWLPDDSTSGFFTGNIWVQKKTTSNCASPVMKQKIYQWSMPTASINRNYTDFSICSGDLVGGYIVVDLTGAADFSYSYSIQSNGLKDENGEAINTEHHAITTSNDTARIALPGRLVNPSTEASKYYTIELTAMNDDFLGDGEIVSDRKEFTITVYPSVQVGTIESVRLNRR
ncbi:MAG: hypothetical protein JXB24_00190 [Bacteroidales bacterium]|nr:hypothetical protein [Bacteroidales bacterium]